MSLAQLQRPLAAAASVLSTRLLATGFAVSRGAPSRPVDANVLVEGRRGAKVKAQGHYKVKPKRTIPKKLGAKKTGGTWASQAAGQPLNSPPGESRSFSVHVSDSC